MRKSSYNSIAVLSTILLLTGCASTATSSETEAPSNSASIEIGMSFDTFVLERWLRDRDIFVSTATELGAEVNVQNANGDAAEQVSQINYLIEKNVDVLVIVPVDGADKALIDAISKARDRGIKVIAYDRIIQNANVDLHASFDNIEVGKLMASAVISQIPADGKIAVIYGSPSDYNVVMVEEGIKNTLADTNISLVYENYANNWKGEYAYEYMSDCLDTLGDIDAVICGNDGLAAQAFKSLSEHRLAGDICLVGQDADIDACQRIVEGTQYMTVYKSIDDLARLSAQYAYFLAQGDSIDTEETFFDGTYEVPYLRLTPVAVTKENIDEEIIASRFHLKNEVYLNVEETEN